MTEESFKLLEKFYKKARALRIEILGYHELLAEGGSDLYAQKMMEFDELDIVAEVIEPSKQKISIEDKIPLVRNVVLYKTNSIVNLDDRTITTIIQKILT